MQSVYVKTLGCKVNTYDSHALESEFRAKGYQVIDDPSKADITILNTCSVTANADKEARYLLRRYRRENPDSLVIATGCYAQTDSDKLLQMNDIDLIFPNEAKDKIVSVADEQFKLRLNGKQLNAPKLAEGFKPVKENKQGHFKSSLNMVAADPSQTRAFLKIQDGCNGFCSYCLIPYARGASRSVPSDQVLTEVRRLIDSGIKEIVFAGIHLGDYGRDLSANAMDFISLVKELFSWPDMVRLRISSLEPSELPEELLIALSQRPELFCDHFHLPLQSGHDRILKLMRRTYTTSDYKDTIELARSYFPNANFGADIIPGFPGETDDEFQATVEFIKSTSLNYLHVFPYSKRPNTAAAKMPGHLEASLVKDRSQHLRQLSDDLKTAYERRYLNTTLSVLWESDRDAQGRLIGRSPNYLEIISSNELIRPNTISKVKLKGFAEKNRILGIVIS